MAGQSQQRNEFWPWFWGTILAGIGVELAARWDQNLAMVLMLILILGMVMLTPERRKRFKQAMLWVQAQMGPGG